MHKKKRKAIAMISGGLDSALAAKLISRQGIDVIGFHVITPFMKEFYDTQNPTSMAARQAAELGIPFHPLHVGEDYIEMVRKPRWGHGSNLNPCIDCHIFFLQKAKELMQDEDADFVFTGEVLNQRPMSQKRPTMRQIEKYSGLEGYLLRPLSARRLEPTIPEKFGWVEREKLLDLVGRGRKQQLALADLWGLEHYEKPAGGCLLTIPSFAVRLKDFFDHGLTDMNSMHLLLHGRLFRLGPRTLLVVGRNESENQALARLARDDDVLMEADGGGSPLCILRGEAGDKEIALAAGITLRFSRNRNIPGTVVRIRRACSAQIISLNPDLPTETHLDSLRV